MPYVSELLIHKNEPLFLAMIKENGAIINGGDEGYTCLAIKNLVQEAVKEFGTSSHELRSKFSESKAEDALDSLKCPILYAIPQDPYTAEDGYTYEKSCFLEYVRSQRDNPEGLVSPMTRQPISNKIFKNKLFAEIVQDVIQNLPDGIYVQVGPGKKTITEIWQNFVQRQKERFNNITHIFAFAGLLGLASTAESTQGNPVRATTLGTAGTTVSLVGTASLTRGVIEASGDACYAAGETTTVAGRNFFRR